MVGGAFFRRLAFQEAAVDGVYVHPIAALRLGGADGGRGRVR